MLLFSFHYDLKHLIIIIKIGCREEKYDLYFMVEASNFIGQANINTAKTFLEHIMASFNLGDNNTHISVSRFKKKTNCH